MRKEKIPHHNPNEMPREKVFEDEPKKHVFCKCVPQRYRLRSIWAAIRQQKVWDRAATVGRAQLYVPHSRKPSLSQSGKYRTQSTQYPLDCSKFIHVLSQNKKQSNDDFHVLVFVDSAMMRMRDVFPSWINANTVIARRKRDSTFLRKRVNSSPIKTTIVLLAKVDPHYAMFRWMIEPTRHSAESHLAENVRQLP